MKWFLLFFSFLFSLCCSIQLTEAFQPTVHNCICGSLYVTALSIALPMVPQSTMWDLGWRHHQSIEWKTPPPFSGKGHAVLTNWICMGNTSSQCPTEGPEGLILNAEEPLAFCGISELFVRGPICLQEHNLTATCYSEEDEQISEALDENETFLPESASHEGSLFLAYLFGAPTVFILLMLWQLGNHLSIKINPNILYPKRISQREQIRRMFQTFPSWWIKKPNSRPSALITRSLYHPLPHYTSGSVVLSLPLSPWRVSFLPHSPLAFPANALSLTREIDNSIKVGMITALQSQWRVRVEKNGYLSLLQSTILLQTLIRRVNAKQEEDEVKWIIKNTAASHYRLYLQSKRKFENSCTSSLNEPTIDSLSFPLSSSPLLSSPPAPKQEEIESFLTTSCSDPSGANPVLLSSFYFSLSPIQEKVEKENEIEASLATTTNPSHLFSLLTTHSSLLVAGYFGRIQVPPSSPCSFFLSLSPSPLQPQQEKEEIEKIIDSFFIFPSHPSQEEERAIEDALCSFILLPRSSSSSFSPLSSCFPSSSSTSRRRPKRVNFKPSHQIKVYSIYGCPSLTSSIPSSYSSPLSHSSSDKYPFFRVLKDIFFSDNFLM